MQDDHEDNGRRPSQNIPKDAEKRGIYEASVTTDANNNMSQGRASGLLFSQSALLHPDAVYHPPKAVSQHQSSPPQSSPLRNLMSPPAPDYEVTQSTDSNLGRSKYAPSSSSSSGYASRARSGTESSNHSGRTRSGTESSEHHEMTAFSPNRPEIAMPRLVIPDSSNLFDIHETEASYAQDSNVSTYSHESEVPLNRYHISHDPGDPPRKVSVITLSADLSLDIVETSEYALSRRRQAALEEVDSAYFSWFHLKVCMIAGVGFFTDAYDIFAINVAATMLDFVYSNGKQPAGPTGALVKASAPVGTLIGQLVFGRLADVAGRKRMYGVELIIIIIGTFGQALASQGNLGTVNIYATIIIWRLVMGLGIGGDYPLSAVIASEFAPSHIRGRMMTAVFANQGWGQFFASVVGALVLVGFRNSFGPSSDLSKDIDRSWRIMLGLGCIPATLALYFRLTIPETPRFTMDIERNVKQATEDIDNFLRTGGYKYDPDSVVIRVNAPRSSFPDFVQYFSTWKNAKLLFGCAYSWFAVDVAFYGVGLNTDKFFCSIGFAQSVLTCDGASSANVLAVPPATVFNDFIHLCMANLLFSGVGLILGYFATFLFIESWGRKRIQLMGFAILSVLFLIMGFLLPALIPKQDVMPVGNTSPFFGSSKGSKVMLFLFCLAGFFLNFGPNTTTFIIPGEAFPTRYRSTCHGLSAASGKIGAILSQFLIVQLLDTATALKVFVAFTATGLLATLLIEETAGRTLEDNSHEPQTHFISEITAH